MVVKLRGLWERENTYIKIHILIPKIKEDQLLHLWNQDAHLISFPVESQKKRSLYTIMIEDTSPPSSYILASLSDSETMYILDKGVFNGHNLTLTPSEVIGKAIVSASESIISQIDGILASL
jgi:hypothetical protein